MTTPAARAAAWNRGDVAGESNVFCRVQRRGSFAGKDGFESGVFETATRAANLNAPVCNRASRSCFVGALAAAPGSVKMLAHFLS